MADSLIRFTLAHQDSLHPSRPIVNLDKSDILMRSD
jgi:hypothetical protein